MSLRKKIYSRISRLMGLHPDVTNLIAGGFKLTNPAQAAYPSENLPFASRVIASGLWNYCFFQFYRHFAGPYWVERQYNPDDPSFIPRAGSMLSVNMTHRTWMGFRGPDSNSFSIVDPAGSISPIVGYYSLELALRENGKLLLPTRGDLKVRQSLPRNLPLPVTELTSDHANLTWTAAGLSESDGVLSEIEYDIKSEKPLEIIVGVRPFNPEGAALIHSMRFNSFEDSTGLLEINGESEIRFLSRPDEIRFGTLETGDAYNALLPGVEALCQYGICTAAVVYQRKGRGRIGFLARTYDSRLYEKDDSSRHKKKNIWFLRKLPGEIKSDVRPPLHIKKKNPPVKLPGREDSVHYEIEKTAERWRHLLEKGAAFQCSRDLWNRAARIFSAHLLSLQTGNEITPGAFTYRQFWFRDATFMLSALSNWNFESETKKVLESYPARQDKKGFFKSHEGEWDSNGQAIWTLAWHLKNFRDEALLKRIYPSVKKGAAWISAKRRTGLKKKILPPGFSAEHLGPADHYYWDNLWSIAGLLSAAYCAKEMGEMKDCDFFRKEASEYADDLAALTRDEREKNGLLTAAPGRPVDPGMIGSICAMYPLDLELFPREQLKNTIKVIYKKFFHEGLFFHPIIHSGYNVYLSVQTAQCFFRLGDVRTARKILKKVLKIRSPLWTYPEAVHPLTGGGVMGDGFHGWAFAEILMLLREFALHREKKTLEIFRGLRRAELQGDLKFGPFPMEGGAVTISGNVGKDNGLLRIRLDDLKKNSLEKIKIWLPGFRRRKMKIKLSKGKAVKERGRIIVTDFQDDIEIRWREDQ